MWYLVLIAEPAARCWGYEIGQSDLVSKLPKNLRSRPRQLWNRDTPRWVARDGGSVEAYALVIAAAAAYGGYHVGLWGDDKDAGIMGSILAALVFAVPMGFWLRRT